MVDPRNTVTAREADIHLRLLPGTDGALALGMAQVMIEEDLYDHEFVEKYVHGFEEYRAYVKQFTPEYTEKITGVPAEKNFGGCKAVCDKWSGGNHVLRGDGRTSYQWSTELSGGSYTCRT